MTEPRQFSRTGQKLHRTARPLAPEPGPAAPPSPALDRPGFDNRGTRHVRTEGERLSFEGPGREAVRRNTFRFGSSHRPKWLMHEKTRGRRCSLCGGSHPEFGCGVPVDPPMPEQLGALVNARPTHDPDYHGPARVRVFPFGALGEDVKRVAGLIAKARAARRAPRLEGRDLEIARAAGLLERARAKRVSQ